MSSTALHRLGQQPGRARSTPTVINDVSRQALVEVRSVLGVLRQVDEALTNSARERSGTLRAGPRPGDGPRVRAWLPLREQTP